MEARWWARAKARSGRTNDGSLEYTPRDEVHHRLEEILDVIDFGVASSDVTEYDGRALFGSSSEVEDNTSRALLVSSSEVEISIGRVTLDSSSKVEENDCRVLCDRNSEVDVDIGRVYVSWGYRWQLRYLWAQKRQARESAQCCLAFSWWQWSW